jgi:hypothetical protein
MALVDERQAVLGPQVRACLPFSPIASGPAASPSTPAWRSPCATSSSYCPSTSTSMPLLPPASRPTASFAMPANCYSTSHTAPALRAIYQSAPSPSTPRSSSIPANRLASPECSSASNPNWVLSNSTSSQHQYRPANTGATPNVSTHSTPASINQSAHNSTYDAAQKPRDESEVQRTL